MIALIRALSVNYLIISVYDIIFRGLLTACITTALLSGSLLLLSCLLINLAEHFIADICTLLSLFFDFRGIGAVQGFLKIRDRGFNSGFIRGINLVTKLTQRFLRCINQLIGMIASINGFLAFLIFIRIALGIGNRFLDFILVEIRRCSNGYLLLIACSKVLC